MALIVALAGTAMAAPTAIKSILNKKEKKQVKSIADGRIKAAAPGLSVASAKKADRADVATSADSIGGQSLANIVVARSDTPGAQCDPSSTTSIVCSTVNLTLPHEGRVLLIGAGGQIAFSNSQASGTCLFRVDGVNSGGSVESGNQYAPAVTGVGARALPNGFTTSVVTAPISAGAHTFALVCNQTAGDVEFESPHLVAALVGSG